MSFPMSIFVLIIALVAGIGGDPFYKTKRTFWSKRNIGERSYNHRLEDINSSALARKLKCSNINRKAKRFTVLPFFTTYDKEARGEKGQILIFTYSYPFLNLRDPTH